MNSGYIHQTLINWALKMLISSIGGEERGGGPGRKGKKLWKQNHFHKFIILDYCFEI